MGATLSLCWITPAKINIAHVGDSRIYHLPANKDMIQVSHDHTHAGWLRREGKINEREERNHPQKHLLQMTLGGKVDKVEPQITSIDYSKGDHLLLCTDGIIDGIWDHHLDDLVRNPSSLIKELKPAERVVKEAKDASGRDNLTALVLAFK